MSLISPAHLKEVTVPSLGDASESLQVAVGIAQLNPEVYPVLHVATENDRLKLQEALDEVADGENAASHVIVRIYRDN